MLVNVETFFLDAGIDSQTVELLDAEEQAVEVGPENRSLQGKICISYEECQDSYKECFSNKLSIELLLSWAYKSQIMDINMMLPAISKEIEAEECKPDHCKNDDYRQPDICKSETEYTILYICESTHSSE